MEINRRSIVSPETGLQLISVFHSKHAPALRTYSPHHHTSFELALFKKGKGIYCCNGKELEFCAGDIFVFSTNEEHFISRIDEEMTVMNLHFEPQYIFFPFQSEQDYSFLRIFFDRSERFCNRLDRDASVTQRIREMFYEIEEEFFNTPSNYEIMVKAKLLSILVLMTRELGYVNSVPSEKSVQIKCVDELSKVIDYINCNFSSDITLNKLAQIGNISPNYLCKVFKQFNGMTIWNYILIRRVDEAKRLLKETELSILEIQLRCGFQTSANFNKMFRRMTGCAPLNYRKRFIK
ncbi:MAG: helix-turn-helix transcriptional regulator [Clostridia bacterium]|nr:helix-turn-helix transcriptional regulator [Clostridia bacterium]